MGSVPDTFYILDGHSQIHRYFHARFQPLSSPITGEPTKATWLFSRDLVKLIREKNPAYIACALDSRRDLCFRRKIYPEYKCGRGETSEEVIIQVNRIHEIVRKMGIPCIRKDAFEADDIIATLARACVSDDVHVVIIGRDKDLFQLLDDPRITMFDPMEQLKIDAEEVERKRGYKPAEAIDVQTLNGDPTDGIPGVPGWGPKTIIKYLRTYKSIQGIIENRGVLSPRLRESLMTALTGGVVETNRQLVTLRTDVPVDVTSAELLFTGINWDEVRPIFHTLGFKRWE